MKKNPLVSVIMNCHNGQKYLKNSIDKSENIVKKFKDKRIKYFESKKFNTLYCSRNLAIKKAKGEFVGFLDVDDLWEKNKLQKQVKYLFKNKGTKIIYSNFYLLNQRRNIKRIGYNQTLPTGFITQKILNNYSVGFVTAIVEKNIFKKYKFNNKYNIIGDFDFFIRVSQKYKFGCIQLPLATYRVHDKNLSGRRIDLHIKEYRYWINIHKKKLERLSYNTTSIIKNLIKLKIKYYLKFLGV